MRLGAKSSFAKNPLWLRVEATIYRHACTYVRWMRMAAASCCIKTIQFTLAAAGMSNTPACSEEAAAAEAASSQDGACVN